MTFRSVLAGGLTMAMQLYTGTAGADQALALVERFEGLTPVRAPDAALETLAGPLPGLIGLRAANEPAVLPLQADSGIPARGTLSFWLLTDRTHHSQLTDDPQGTPCPHGGGFTRFAENVLSGFLAFSLHAVHSDFRIRFAIGEGPVSLTLVPGLPGPAWYHVALEWDAERGVQNAYLNGIPVRPPHLPGKPWTVPAAGELTLSLDRFAVSDLRLRPDWIDPAERRREITAAYWGNGRHLFGERPPAPFRIDEYKGALLYENPLRQAGDVADWVMEGPAEMSFDDGWMRLSSERSENHPGHFVFWCPVQTPEDFIVEWNIQVLKPSLAIVFFSARAQDGKDLFDPTLETRDGRFELYHSGELDAYHISYYTHSRQTTNLRKNHGFFLAAVGSNPMQHSPARVFHVQLMKNGAHIQLAVDGEVALDFHDDGKTYGPVLGGGRIGLRQMAGLDARYRDFRVYNVRPERRPSGQDRPAYGEMPKTYHRRGPRR